MYAFGIGLPALALEDPARLPAAGGVACAGHALAELAVRILRIFFHHARAIEALLIAQLHAAQVQHAILHRGEHLLPASGRVALVERRDDAKRQMQPGAAVADLRTGDQRRAIVESGRRRRAASALRDVLIHLAVLVRTGAEPLDRRDDHSRVERIDALPRKSHPIECARREVLDQHVAVLDQRLEDRLASRMLGVERDRAFVAIQHREVEAVDVRDVAELPARDVAGARALDLDDVGAEIAQQLRARRTRLHVREIQDLDSV